MIPSIPAAVDHHPHHPTPTKEFPGVFLSDSDAYRLFMGLGYILRKRNVRKA